jgi:hypothetical protein
MTIFKTSSISSFFFFVFFVFWAQNLWATDLTKHFTVGSGANYGMKMLKTGEEVSVSIYFTKVEKNIFHVEYYMKAENTFVPIELWQQFHCLAQLGEAIRIQKGFVLLADSSHPEEMTEDMLKGFDGVMISDFLFSDEEKLKGLKVKDEELNLYKRKVKSTHYRQSRNGQTIDFWLSPQFKPLGLVKLISRSETKSHQNYQLELLQLSKNVKAKIDPSQAKAMGEKAKTILKFFKQTQ